MTTEFLRKLGEKIKQLVQETFPDSDVYFGAVDWQEVISFDKPFAEIIPGNWEITRKGLGGPANVMSIDYEISVGRQALLDKGMSSTEELEYNSQDDLSALILKFQNTNFQFTDDKNYGVTAKAKKGQGRRMFVDENTMVSGPVFLLTCEIQI